MSPWMIPGGMCPYGSTPWTILVAPSMTAKITSTGSVELSPIIATIRPRMTRVARSQRTRRAGSKPGVIAASSGVEAGSSRGGPSARRAQRPRR